MASPSKANLTDYQYKLYSDYLEQLDGIMTKYGQQTGLSIEYWHIKVDLSLNYDDELKIQNSYKHYVYDLYHFLPTINMTPLTYQLGYDPQKQGTSNTASGSFSIYLLEQPLPGDMFRFYPYGDATDRTEIFRVTNVRYMRTSKGKLDLYQIDFETAPFKVDTLEHVRINEIWCWDTERHVFNDETQCSQMECIIHCRDKLVDYINEWYDEQNGWYGLCKEGSGSDIDWANLCMPGTPEVAPKTLEQSSEPCEEPPQINPWPPGPGWPGWPSEPYPEPTPPDNLPQKNCGGKSTTRPLVFLNTILKRLKKIFEAMDLKPIYGTGTAKIPIEWGLPFYETVDSDGNQIQIPRDYWETFTCLSYQQGTNSGELFNITKILAGECDQCPPELISEIECHRELYMLVTALVQLLKPLLTEEQLKDKTCDRKCCDMYDPNFVGKCISWASQGNTEFGSLFWDYAGSDAGRNAESFYDMYENALDVPLYITFRDGAHWTKGGRVG